MKKLLGLITLILLGGYGYLYSQELHDDLPHILMTALKPSHEQPVHHFYYGLQSGELLFTGMSLDKAALESLKEANPENMDYIRDLLQATTCQLDYIVLDSAVSDNTATVTLRLNTVPPANFVKTLVGSAISGFLKGNTSQTILENFQKTGCTGKRQEMDQTIALVKEDGAWKISSEKTGTNLMLDLFSMVVSKSI